MQNLSHHATQTNSPQHAHTHTLTNTIGALTFLFATENSKPTLSQFVAALGDKEKAEVEVLNCFFAFLLLYSLLFFACCATFFLFL
jgi:hypothetical protein